MGQVYYRLTLRRLAEVSTSNMIFQDGLCQKTLGRIASRSVKRDSLPTSPSHVAGPGNYAAK